MTRRRRRTGPVRRGTAPVVVAAAASCAAVLSSCGAPAVDGPFVGGASAGDLFGDRTWVLVAGEVDGRPLAVPEGRRVTLTYDGEGRVGGTAACNGYGSGVGVSASGISFGPGVDRSEMACEPAAMAAEDAFLGALLRVTGADRSGDVLRLAGRGATLTLEAVAPLPVAELTGPTWTLEALLDGGTTASPGGEPATLRLTDAGSLTGSTGCRDVTGRYVVAGDDVLAAELDAGTAECPEDLWAQDSLVVTVLGDGFRAEVDGRTLTLTSDGGAGLVYRAD